VKLVESAEFKKPSQRSSSLLQGLSSWQQTDAVKARLHEPFSKSHFLLTFSRLPSYGASLEDLQDDILPVLGTDKRKSHRLMMQGFVPFLRKRKLPGPEKFLEWLQGSSRKTSKRGQQPDCKTRPERSTLASEGHQRKLLYRHHFCHLLAFSR
jgi:hypothetical protein